MRPDEIKQAADDFGMSVDSATMMRVRYLQNLLSLWCEYIDEQTNEIPESDTMAIIGELITIRNHQDRAKSGIILKGITEEMIRSAREYPIESVIEFVRGTAVAFCHADKRPSLTLDRKRNRAHCFPCGKDFNAVDTLIERDGYSFIEAVKFLSGRM